MACVGSYDFENVVVVDAAVDAVVVGAKWEVWVALRGK